MADNQILDNGDEATFTAATDDVSGVQYPFVKLADGTLNSTEKIGGDAANGLDVDVTRIVPGTSATHLGKAEDAAHVSGDTGVMALGVRQDTPAALSGTDGDYQPVISDASGRLHVAPVEITDLTPGIAATSLGKAEDAPHTSQDVGVMSLAVRQDTLGGTVTADGDYAALKVDGNGALYASVSSMPAADATTDSISTKLATDVLMNDHTPLTPKFFSETVAASDTDEELIALVSAKKLRIISLAVQCGGTATDVTFESSTTTRKHKVPAGANGGQILPFNPLGWFETASGQSLTCTTGAGSSVEISGVYVEV